ncbi:MAG: hypothetical protein HY784_10505, partial [Chloroflexi bacterium]|nr:hypothetical protein [Chloroflexota bacterium]
MAKTFYTLRDLQDLAAQGVTRLEYDDEVVITHEARDRAPHLGIELARAECPCPTTPAGGRPETGRPETGRPETGRPETGRP